MHINTLGPLNANDLDYDMDMYLRLAWKDPRLSMRRFGINRTLTLNGQHLLSRMWKPDLFFVNAKEVRTHSVTIPNELLQLSPDGDILISIRLTMKLSCLMLFHNFPFDKQKCYALARPYAHPLNQIMLVWREMEPVFLELPIEMQDFDLMAMSYDDYTEEIETGNFSCLRLRFLLDRQNGFHMIQTYLPTYIVVMVSWIPFWIRPDVIPPRAILGVKTLLTLAGIYLGASTHLPNVVYSKAIDVWLVACILLIIGALIEFGIVNYLFLSKLTRAEYLQAISVFRRHKIPKDASGLPVNQKRAWAVDRASRAMFPLLFVGFNIVYWAVYLTRPMLDVDRL
ncbi:glycine receptor subunit alpha-3-like [Ixodes scapularis]